MSNPLKIIFAGSGEFGLPTLRALRAANHEILQIFTQPDRPAGRGRKLTPTPIGQYALNEKLPLIPTQNINAEKLPAADVMVVIAFGQKIADPVVHHPKFGSINLHASLLPKYRGAAPINAAILAGETIAGNSIIRLAKKMDAGEILAQSKLEIGELETAGELHDRLAIDGAPLMLSVLDSLAASVAKEQPQNESLATLAPKMSRDTTRLDWNLPAKELAQKIRGLYPWPGCRVRLLDGQTELARITLVRARAIQSSSQNPGSIDSNLAIATQTGSLEIIELQPEGKRPMPLAAYRNGHRWEPGLRIESIT
ncbi:MAG TPA: methionyl-tRNA formyltransferase [Tepidisphaeraceae bacterium]|jgi:methionyl-tRNA formyltransferase|nr:methionyl-tRNA formyltransferase [Tepidisphaeraceae bacterium]